MAVRARRVAALLPVRIDGAELGRVTSGRFNVERERIVGVDIDTGQVHFIAHCDPARPYDVHVCRVDARTVDFLQLTHDEGLHDATMAPSGRALLDVHSRLSRPPRTDLLSPDGKLLATVAEADASRLRQRGWTPPRSSAPSPPTARRELRLLWKPPVSTRARATR